LLSALNHPAITDKNDLLHFETVGNFANLRMKGFDIIGVPLKDFTGNRKPLIIATPADDNLLLAPLPVSIVTVMAPSRVRGSSISATALEKARAILVRVPAPLSVRIVLRNVFWGISWLFSQCVPKRKTQV